MCNDNKIATVDAAMLGCSVNLNSILPDSGFSGPWEDAASAVWAGKPLDRPDETRWDLLRMATTK